MFFIKNNKNENFLKLKIKQKKWIKCNGIKGKRGMNTHIKASIHKTRKEKSYK